VQVIKNNLDFTLSACSPEGFTVNLKSGKSWGTSIGEMGSLRLVQYGSYSPAADVDVVVGTVVADFGGYLYANMGPLYANQTKMSLKGHWLQPEGVRPADVKVVLAPQPGGCTPEATVTALTNSEIRMEARGLYCTSPGPMVAYLTVAQKPSQKQPGWVEQGAAITGDAHTAKGVVIGTIVTARVKPSSSSIAMNAPRITVQGHDFDNACHAAAKKGGRLFFSHLSQSESPGNGNGNAFPACDFEDQAAPTCSWMQDATDDFEWDSRLGPSVDSSPPNDGVGAFSHSSGPISGSDTGGRYDGHRGYFGRYLAIDASSPRLTGHEARLISPRFTVHSATSCFNVSYHMRGHPAEVGSLKLSLLREDGGDGTGTVSWTTIWNQFGPRGDSWLVESASLKQYMQETVRLRITATTGNGYAGDIAIDSLAFYTCPDLTPVQKRCCGEPPLAPTTAVKVESCTDNTMVISPIGGGDWGTRAGPLYMHGPPYGYRGRVQIATLIPVFRGSLRAHSGKDPLIDTNAGEVVLYGRHLKPGGASERDVRVHFVTANGIQLIASLKSSPMGYSDDRVLVIVPDMATRGTPGVLKAALTVGGASTPLVTVGVLSSPIRVRPSRQKLIYNAERLSIEGDSLPLICPRNVRIASLGSELRQGIDYSITNCTAIGFTAVPLPGRYWGWMDGPLRLLRYGESGEIEVTVATLASGNLPVLHSQSHLTPVYPHRILLPNTGGSLTLAGERLKQSYAGSLQDVSVTFNATCGKAPTAGAMSSHTATSLTVALLGLDSTCEGSLLASITVGGISSGGPVAVRHVVSPVLLPNPLLVVTANAEEIQVRGLNLPPVCPSSERVVIGGLLDAASDSGTVSGGLHAGSDFTVTACTGSGFVLRLTPGRRWRSSHGQLRIQRYGTSTLVDVLIANVISPFLGSLATTANNLPNNATEITIHGTSLKPPGAKESDVRLELVASSGLSPRNTLWVKQGSYTSTSVTFLANGMPSRDQSATWPSKNPHSAIQLSQARGGDLRAKLWIGGKSSGALTQIATVTTFPIRTSSVNLAQNAEELVVYAQDADLVPTCPSAGGITVKQDTSFGTLALGVDYSISACGKDSFKLTLEPHKLWGSVGGPLKLTKYANVLMDVQIATILPPLGPSIEIDTTSIPNTATELVIRGRNLKPGGATGEEVYLVLSNETSWPLAPHRLHLVIGAPLLDAYTGKEEGKEYLVQMGRLGLEFHPSRLPSLQVGDTVTWLNIHPQRPLVSVMGTGPNRAARCTLTNTITARTGDSGDSSWHTQGLNSFTFSTAGTFYVSVQGDCLGVSGEIMSIVVRARGSPSGLLH